MTPGFLPLPQVGPIKAALDDMTRAVVERPVMRCDAEPRWEAVAARGKRASDEYHTDAPTRCA